MAYPANIDSFPTVANDTVSMNTHRDLENSQSTAIVAIETELGPDVSGSFASLAERLAAGGGGGNEFRGDWNSATTYQDGDVVIYNGLPYIAVDPSLNEAPEAWAVEGAGIQGPVGPAGPQGPQGAASTVPGPQGPQGEKGDPTTPLIKVTQAQYDALTPPDPNSLYVIIG